MKTRLLATTALALGLLLPAAAMAQQQSGDSPAKPTMENKTSPGTTGTTSGSSGMSSQSGTSTGTSSGMSSDTKAPGTAGTTTGTTGATTMSTLDKSVVGKTLYGANDEEVGEIDDVVVSQSGGVESVLIDVGGFLGLGAKTIAVPAEDIEMQGDKLVSDSLTKAQAEQMPEYKK